MGVTPLLDTTAAVLVELRRDRPELSTRAGADTVLADALVRLVDCSRSIAASLRRDADAAREIADTPAFRSERDTEGYRRQLRVAFSDDGVTERALRRLKRREFNRIAARDLLGVADLPTVGRELAALADTIIAGGLEIARPTVPFTVIGMGKLGGKELNYSSDIDVIFVHEGDQSEAVKAAQRFVKAVGAATADGVAWRVDADLRPEGSIGILSRSVEGCRVYYDERAEAWERQALIKARACGGDLDVATRFFDAVSPSVWATRPRPDGVAYIRTLKDRAEGLLLARAELDLKRGPGGIRDVEFAVQLLQLVHGGRDPAVRSPNTLDALRQLVRAGHLESRDAEHLAVAYRFLRTVEHRLQLRDERQTHDLPTTAGDADWLARIMGHPTNEDFDEQLERFRSSVRTIHQRVFRRPTISVLLDSKPVEEGSTAVRLAELGFNEPDRGADLLDRISGGQSPGARLLRELTPLILGDLAEAVEPDLGLLRLSWIIDGPARRDRVLAAFRESPTLISRVCWLLGSSAAVTSALRTDPAMVEVLSLDAEPPAPGELAAAPIDVVHRERARLAASFLLDGVSSAEVGARLAKLAEESLTAALEPLGGDAPVAVIGLGRLGTRDLSFHSDLDLIVVCDPGPGDDVNAIERAVQQFVAGFDHLGPGGRVWEIDCRLRPEGVNGRMAPSLASCSRYYSPSGRSQLWEYQALIRARGVAGDHNLAARFLELVDPVVYQRGGLTPEQHAEFVRMKRRVETERRPEGVSGRRHLKLGPGALIDVEFAVQLLQLHHGEALPALKGAGTLVALAVLTEAGLLSDGAATVMAESYRLCERLRNVRHLHRAREADVVPDDPDDAESFATLAGFADRHELLVTLDSMLAASRAATESLVR